MKYTVPMQEDFTIQIPKEAIEKTGLQVGTEMTIEAAFGKVELASTVVRRDFCQSCYQTISTVSMSGTRVCRECYTKITGRIWVDLTPEEIARIVKNEPARLRYYVVYDQLRELDDIERLYGTSLPYDDLYWFLRLRGRTPIAMIHGDYADMYEDLLPELEKREEDRIHALEMFSDKYRLDLRGAKDRDSFGIATHLNWRLSNDEFLELRQIMRGDA